MTAARREGGREGRVREGGWAGVLLCEFTTANQFQESNPPPPVLLSLSNLCFSVIFSAPTSSTGVMWDPFAVAGRYMST